MNEDNANIFSKGFEEAGKAYSSAQRAKDAKRMAKENQRRTLANLLNSALRRDRNLFKKGQEYGDDLSDYQSQALQHIARGFAESLQGSTRG